MGGRSKPLHTSCMDMGRARRAAGEHRSPISSQQGIPSPSRPPSPHTNAANDASPIERVPQKGRNAGAEEALNVEATPAGPENRILEKAVERDPPPS